IGNHLMDIVVKNAHLTGKKNIPTTVKSALSCLDLLLGTDDDPMGLNDNPQPIINCQNGELVIESDGSITPYPHRPESRLIHCLPIIYDPSATCPKYDEALLGIFSKSNNCVDVIRHWHEFEGYAIQSKRDISSFWLLIGHGSNGKSALLKLLQKLLGPDSVLNDSISAFQKDNFCMAALHGKLLFIDDDMAESVTLADGL